MSMIDLFRDSVSKDPEVVWSNKPIRYDCLPQRSRTQPQGSMTVNGYGSLVTAEPLSVGSFPCRGVTSMDMHLFFYKISRVDISRGTFVFFIQIDSG